MKSTTLVWVALMRTLSKALTKKYLAFGLDGLAQRAIVNSVGTLLISGGPLIERPFASPFPAVNLRWKDDCWQSVTDEPSYWERSCA